jgi:hypothetical protein
MNSCLSRPLLGSIAAATFAASFISPVLHAAPAPAGTAEATPKPKATWWEGVNPYEAPPRPSDGRHMTVTMEKLTGKRKLDRPLLIWALGSSYTNFQGDGSELIALIKERFPNAPEIVYKKQVGAAIPYELLDGWVRHLVTAEQPDVVILYAIGKPAGLEETIREIQAATTADIIVPSIHFRKQRDNLWNKTPENYPPDEDIPAMRVICAKYGVEFVENAAEMAGFMNANNLRPAQMTFDSVHQHSRTRKINWMNTARHFNIPDKFAYDPDTRERRIEAGKGEAVTARGFTPAADGKAISASAKGASVQVKFKGKRLDVLGAATPDGGSVDVLIDGKPAEEYPAFVATFIQPQKTNANKTANEVAPHGIFIEPNAIPQQWTITRIGKDPAPPPAGKKVKSILTFTDQWTARTDEDAQLEFELVGSVTGPDGKGKVTEPFKSTSGQIRLELGDWRTPESTKAGDKFIFDVKRTTTNPASFRAEQPGPVRTRLAFNLPAGEHTVTLTTKGDGPVTIEAFEAFEPPRALAREK